MVISLYRVQVLRPEISVQGTKGLHAEPVNGFTAGSIPGAHVC